MAGGTLSTWFLSDLLEQGKLILTSKNVREHVTNGFQLVPIVFRKGIS